MSVLFAVFSLAILSIVKGWRYPAISLVLLGLVLSSYVFWYHITDVLKINW